MGEDLKSVYVDDAMSAFRVERLLAVCFYGAARVSHVRALELHASEMVDTSPHGAAAFVLVSSHLGGAAVRQAPSPSAALREAAVSAIQRLDRRLLGCAVVLDEQGMAASIKRSTMSALLLMARHQHTRVFSEMGPAADWLGGRLKAQGEWDAVRVFAAVSQMVSTLAADRATATTP